MCSCQCTNFLDVPDLSFTSDGDNEDRTRDLLLARQALSQLSYTPIGSGTHLLSHAVPSVVSSAVRGLTIVFGMGTGVSPGRIGTRKFIWMSYNSHRSDSGTPFPHHAIRRMASHNRLCPSEHQCSSVHILLWPLCSLVAWTFITEH